MLVPADGWHRAKRPMRAWLLPLLVILGSLEAGASEPLPPSPYDILKSRDLETPLLDAVPFCVPAGLDLAIDPILEQATALEWNEARKMLADWTAGLDQAGPRLVLLDAILLGRAAKDREALLDSEKRFRSLLRDPEMAAHRLCARLELARVLLLLSRESEAAAQLSRVEDLLGELDRPSPHGDEVAFWRAEILYRTGDAFDAHLAYRKLAKIGNARLALAARLRLTDLSFDAGRIKDVSTEYEALLPRAPAFGASITGWALRASEAAIDVGNLERALRWIERFLEAGPPRDSRDAAEIRLADIDVAFEDPLRARKRLSTITGRRRGDPIGALASIRAIALGVSSSSPDRRLDVLLKAVREQRRGVRRYALGVLMGELAHRGDLDGALAVATRLAYEGIDPVVTPGFGTQLDELLSRAASKSREVGGCRELVRALGGRYGILIERASSIEPFARVGACFEEMELPWLAATVYRTIARRFGVRGAQAVALPLARSSLAIGELTLARSVASASLEQGEGEAAAWKAILVEADFLEGRLDEAVTGAREILDSSDVEAERGKLLRMMARSLEARGDIDDARFIAERVPDWIARTPRDSLARANMLEAAMLSAHALRAAGHGAEATALYRTVDEFAKPSALRSSARFWLGLAGEPDARGGSAWGDDPNVELGTPWGRLAIFERHFEPLAKAYSEAIR